MGTMAIANGVAESMPVTLMGEIVDSPAPVKLPTALRQIGVRRDYQMINPRDIDVEPGFNARDYSLPENRAHLDRLKLLIIEAGKVEKPIIVRLNKETGRANVIDGECRLRAVMELIAEGREPFTFADMPCYPASAGSDDPVVRRFASLNANEGKPLSKWELGKGYQDLFDLNVSIETIAKKTANSVAFVKEAMELAAAPDEVKQMLSEQAVTPAEVVRQLRNSPDTAVHTITAKVQANRAAGNKGPVKRDKAKPQKSPLALPKAVIDAILALVVDVPAEDLNDLKGVAVVPVAKLLKVLSYAVTEDEIKAAGVELTEF